MTNSDTDYSFNKCDPTFQIYKTLLIHTREVMRKDRVKSVRVYSCRSITVPLSTCRGRVKGLSLSFYKTLTISVTLHEF